MAHDDRSVSDYESDGYSNTHVLFGFNGPCLLWVLYQHKRLTMCSLSVCTPTAHPSPLS